MSQAFNHGYRNELLAGNKENNPVKLSRCKTVSNYEAITVTPEQMVGILHYLDSPTTRLEWTLALTCAATGMRGEEVFGLKWQDINFDDGRIKICRGWSKGVETAGKTPGSMTSVAMHPALAAYLREWRSASLHADDSDWVFASSDAKGRIPRAASTMAK
jgi:integrase